MRGASCLPRTYHKRGEQSFCEEANEKVRTTRRHPPDRREKGAGAVKEWLDAVLRGMDDALVVSGTDGLVKFMNPAAERLTGWSLEDAVDQPLDDVVLLVDGKDGERARNPVAFLSEGVPFSGPAAQTLLLVRDGSRTPVERTTSVIRNDRGESLGAALVIRTVTGKSHALEEMEKSERFLSSIFDSIYDPFCILDRDFVIVKANEAYARLKGTSLARIIGTRCYEELEGRGEVCDACVVERTFRSLKPNAKEKGITGPEGQDVWVEIFTYPIMDEAGGVSHVVVYDRDITDRKKAEEERQKLIRELEYLSRVDMLTGLMNRRALMEFLEQEAERAKRYKGELSLILCDVDYFKEINDTYGHSVGDRVLGLLGGLLREMVRKADMAGRYGGDEFLLVMPETDIGGARDFAERLRRQVEKASLQRASGEVIRFSLSFGIAGFQRGTDNTDTVISRADDALYKAKKEGKNRVEVISL
jgi:diguanylate cyclase (GGDEF)-like protein/PAS domain S-box-containing protein